MRRNSPFWVGLALLAMSVVPAQAAENVHPAGPAQVADAYRIANFVTAYSTPQERNILSHYPDAADLPVSYRTSRLLSIHGSMHRLAATGIPVRFVRYSEDAVIPATEPELTVVESIIDGADNARVAVTVLQLDVRTNLRLIREFEEAVADGRPLPRPADWQEKLGDNPSRRETHRWRLSDGSWRLVDDTVAMLKTR